MSSVMTVENMTKSFNGKEVLKGVDISVSKGEVICILGPSGSGKTTFLRCLNFLEQADNGRFRINDLTVDLHTPNKKDVRKMILQMCMVFQGYELFRNMTVLQNVMEGLTTARKIPKKEAQHRALVVLKKVGLLEKAELYPSQLSGGQQQRVGIARAVVLNPTLLLLDEPTSALDPELVDEVLETVKTIAKEGQTMVIVTHEMQFAYEVADKIIFMADGNVVEVGSPKEVFRNPKNQKTKDFLARLSFR